MKKLLVTILFLSTLTAFTQGTTVTIKKEADGNVIRIEPAGGNFIGRSFMGFSRVKPEYAKQWGEVTKQIDEYHNARIALLNKLNVFTAQYKTNKTIITNIVIYRNGVATYDKILLNLGKKRNSYERQ